MIFHSSPPLGLILVDIELPKIKKLSVRDVKKMEKNK